MIEGGSFDGLRLRPHVVGASELRAILTRGQRPARATGKAAARGPRQTPSRAKAA